MIPALDYTDILKLDIDDASRYDPIKLRNKLNKLGLSVKAIGVTPSKSLGIHVYIYLNNSISIDLVPLYEALLGSDIIRSCLIEWRIRNNSYLDVFFHKVSTINMPIPMRKTATDVIKFMRCRCPSLYEKLLWFHNNDPEKVYRFISESVYE